MKICSVCGIGKDVFYSNKYKILICSRHYKQLKRVGKVIRTHNDGNDIIEKSEFFEMKLYKNGVVVAVTKFDKKHIDKISPYTWGMCEGYVRGIKCGKQIFLHRLINDDPDGMFIDHKDGDRLNNLDVNLRICSKLENARNRINVCGVTYHYKNKKWIAQIKLNYKNIYLGSFDTKRDALIKRLEAQKKYFGEFSNNKHLQNLINGETINNRKNKLQELSN